MPVDDPTVAVAVLELVHTPPVTRSANVVVSAGHTDFVPVMALGPVTLRLVVTLHAAAE